MKKLFNHRLILLVCGIFLTGILNAQQVTVSGKVTDANDGTSIPGVNILEKGTTNGTVTDIEGNYSLSVSTGAIIQISFVGYLTQEVEVGNQTTINFTLEFDAVNLKEVVTIGYGTTRKEDATGSVIAVSADEFNQGAITSPQDLVVGKIAGVQITDQGGAPGTGSTIRIRGGSSLMASNDPLFVIDGVPIDNDGIAGMRNPLNTIHPSDIETFTVLKDASATAIYGSRASNGVIMITTKRGKRNRPLRMTYDGKFSLGFKTGVPDVLNADEYRTLIQDRYASNPNATDLLGTENTNWQDVIYEPAFGMDHNLSFTGGIKVLPYRASIGYSDQSGILKTTNLKRTTLAISLNPTFLDDHLRVDVNLKGMYIKNRFADWGSVGGAVAFDPTQPVYDENSPYGGYFTWTQPNGDPITIATTNPLAQLEMTDNTSNVYRSLGNAKLEYRLHPLPELKATLNLGYDVSESKGQIYVPENASWTYDALNGGGENTNYTQNKSNELLDLYLNYNKEIGSISSRIDVTAGYSWQHFWRKGTNYSTNVSESVINADTDYETENFLVSFFGRLNYSYKSKYLLTFSLRYDGSSRFAEENRWGLFPSLALAWNITDEAFMEGAQSISNLKLRLGYGITGQQNITNNDYPYLASYTYSQNNAQYMFGNNYITTLRPEGYDANLKWEETTTYNVGLDYGFLSNRITGDLDIYLRKTKDLINTIPVPAGTNLTNQILTNVGDLENSGFEFSINGKAFSTPDFVWEIGFNLTYNQNKITKLTAVDDPNYKGIYVGGISGGVGNTIQIHSVGYPAYSFYVYEQVYNENGEPIEGLYVDKDENGEVNEDDKYRYKKPAPVVFMGLSSMWRYKNWDISFAGRFNIGNYVYNNMFSNYGSYSNLYNSAGYLSNVNSNVLETNFNNPKYFTDYYMENASFFRMDNITVGYHFENIAESTVGLRLYGTVQNAFVVTNYRGLDPEVSGGIDNNIYPRPRTFVVGVSLDF